MTMSLDGLINDRNGDVSSNTLLSCEYITQAKLNCFRLPVQAEPVAFNLARPKAGSRRLARIAMIAMTTSNSMSVKPSPFWGTLDRFGWSIIRRVSLLRFTV